MIDQELKKRALEPAAKGDPAPREKVLKVGKMITDVIEHKLGKPRERRPWFNRSWYISLMVLKDKLADVIGEMFAGLFDNLENRW